mmetsp:Transcript_10965/g.19950  ORF Transcript_10965/g.19950 Transcript_10965/m.19950 type:complete len:210 (-) Transcript_10965:2082-2711(-)
MKESAAVIQQHQFGRWIKTRHGDADQGFTSDTKHVEHRRYFHGIQVFVLQRDGRQIHPSFSELGGSGGEGLFHRVLDEIHDLWLHLVMEGLAHQILHVVSEKVNESLVHGHDAPSRHHPEIGLRRIDLHGFPSAHESRVLAVAVGTGDCELDGEDVTIFVERQGLVDDADDLGFTRSHVGANIGVVLLGKGLCNHDADVLAFKLVATVP